MSDPAGAEATARETTPLPLGWPVLGTDGPLGRLTDVVVHPEERRVTHLVVEDRHGDARLVPADRLVQGRSPGRVVVISCAGEELASMDSIRAFSMLDASNDAPHGGEQADVGVEDVVVVPGFGAAEFGLSGPELVSTYGLSYDLIPTGSAELRHESAVVSLDGDEIGKVDGFLVAGDRLTHVVLQRTHLTDKGAAAIPIDSVTMIETDRITVALPEDAERALHGASSHWLPFA
ncbi:MAG TPA: PRC-barrel domain-containing protein [Gaiellaceae bacterium]|nr:PRC-barrel domain-containing protein [Gaiellaceae bacterium]